MMQEYFRDPAAEAYRVHTHDYVRKTRDCREWATGLQIDPVGNLRMCHWMEPFGNVKDGDIPLVCEEQNVMFTVRAAVVFAGIAMPLRADEEP